MSSAVKILLVGAVSTALLLLGIASASAAAPSPAAAPIAVTALAPSPAATAAAAASKHSGLQCRSHTAESKPVSGKVVVPKSYCYDPNTTNHTGWHDYCTHSPDQYSSVLGNADFRGPCAKHDMCLQATRSHSKCDGPLLSNLKTNCKQRFSWHNPARYSCEEVAYTYYLMIKAYTLL